MKAFIVISATYYEGYEIECAFSSLAAAWKFMDDYAEKFNKEQSESNKKIPYRKDTDFLMEKEDDGYANCLEEICVSEFELLN